MHEAKRDKAKRGLAVLGAAGTLLFATAPIHAQGLVGVTQGADPALYFINPNTGATARIGSVTTSDPLDQVSALTVQGTSYYAGSLLGNLYQINPFTAVTTLLGSTGNPDPIYGLAFLNSTLYGLQNDPTSGIENLDSFSFSGPTVTESMIGQVADSSGNLVNGRGLAVFNGQLVTADAGNGAGGYLFSLDPTTGLGTSLDTTGGTSPGLPLNGLSGLAALNGTLYAGDNDPSVPDYALYQVSPGSAATTQRADLGGLRFGALAGPSVPEASALWLLAPGLGLLGLTAIRRRRSAAAGIAAAAMLLTLLPFKAQAAPTDPLTYPAPTSPSVLPVPPGDPMLANTTQHQLNTGKFLTLPPLGTQTNVGSLPFDLVLSPDGKYAVSSDTGFREFLIAVKTSDGTETSSVPFGDAHGGYIGATKEGLFYGLVFKPTKNSDGTYTLYAAQGNENTIAILSLDDTTGLLTDTKVRFHGNTPSTGAFGAALGVGALDTPAGMAFDATTGLLYVANNDPALPTLSSGVSVYDTTVSPITEKGRFTFPFGTFGPTNYPFSIAVLPGGGKIFVGSERDGTVYVLSTNVPGFATPAGPQLIGAIKTGSHPLGLTFARNTDGSTNYAKLYVANAQSDTISVISTATNAVTNTVLLRPQGALALPGVTPNNLTVSPDGKTLYATLADMNAVAVIDTGRNRLLGYIPVGWYPTAVVISPDNKNLLVTSAKGHYTRYPNPAYGTTLAASNSIQTYDENMIEGDIQTLAVPSPALLATLTQMTLADNRITPLTDDPPVNPLAGIGLKSGKIKHVLYIVKENRTYDQILGDLKDGPDGTTGNPLGNGESDLDLDTPVNLITPNLHALARRFIVLDNYYEGGEVSEDGWNWSTQGMANEFTVRNVPYNYSGRNYFTQTDFQGQNNGYPVGGFPATDVDGVLNSSLFPMGAPPIPDIAQGPGGYIWDDAQKAGLSYRNYGVDMSTGAAGLIPDNYPTHTGQHPEGHDLAGKSDYDYRRFDTNYPDSEAPYYYAYGTYPALAGTAYTVPSGTATDPNALFNETAFGKYHAPSRYSEFKREFAEMLAKGTPTQPDAGVPTFMTMTVMSDHTQGSAAGGKTNPNIHSAKSMIADNDYGVGQIIDLISHNKAVWDSTAVFIIEDDSQDGPDHVDTHRSICYAISPWINQGTLDSHFYNTDSVLKTIELLLGLPAMNQYDAVADPILDWKTALSPGDDAPYTAVLPAKNIIEDLNPTMLALQKLDHKSLQYRLAMLCSKMDFTHPDAAPEQALNMAIWKSIKGWDTPVPAPIYGLTPVTKTSVGMHTHLTTDKD